MSKKFAVAHVGWRGWSSDGAIGDGITTALCALVSLHDTQAEAERKAKALNSAQRRVMPGSPDVPIYEARPFRPRDYVGRQHAERHQVRPCDWRRAAGAV